MVFIRNGRSQTPRGWFYATILLSVVILYQQSITIIGEYDENTSTIPVTTTTQYNNNNNPLAIPMEKAVALPSVQTEESINRKNLYGGKGDKKHLGGFTDIDTAGISPRAWKWMITTLNIQSIIDVGCGRGISTTWFLMHGMDTLCVEGSHDAKENTMLPDPDTQMIEHDFSRGPWWPEKTYDAVWCVEFLEHVGRNFHKNYLPTFRKAGLIFVTHSINGGWHHVEVHRMGWWKTKMELYGFRYLPELTMELRSLVWNETNDYANKGVAPNGKPIGAPHIHANMLIFYNPMVTALPQHHHLYYEPGCFVSRGKGILTQRDCGIGPIANPEETLLPDEFKPIQLTKEQDVRWFEWVKARVKPYQQEETEKKVVA